MIFQINLGSSCLLEAHQTVYTSPMRTIWPVLQQRGLNKWIEEPLGRRFYNFQPPTPTVSHFLKH